MLTTTHALIAATATTRPYMKPWMITLGWLGGFAPDASVFLMVATARMSSVETPNMWRKPDGLYWQEPWQTFSAISNSIPMWLVMALVGFYLLRKTKYKQCGMALLVFGAGALLHVLADFPVHTDDAHVHFWPFTDWRFHSPVSYYQHDHFGNIVGPVEMVADIAMAGFLFWRFHQWPVRIMAVLMVVPTFLSLRFLFF